MNNEQFERMQFLKAIKHTNYQIESVKKQKNDLENKILNDKKYKILMKELPKNNILINEQLLKLEKEKRHKRIISEPIKIKMSDLENLKHELETSENILNNTENKINNEIINIQKGYKILKKSLKIRKQKHNKYLNTDNVWSDKTRNHNMDLFSNKKNYILGTEMFDLKTVKEKFENYQNIYKNNDKDKEGKDKDISRVYDQDKEKDNIESKIDNNFYDKITGLKLNIDDFSLTKYHKLSNNNKFNKHNKSNFNKNGEINNKNAKEKSIEKSIEKNKEKNKEKTKEKSRENRTNRNTEDNNLNKTGVQIQMNTITSNFTENFNTTNSPNVFKEKLKNLLKSRNESPFSKSKVSKISKFGITNSTSINKADRVLTLSVDFKKEIIDMIKKDQKHKRNLETISRNNSSSDDSETNNKNTNKNTNNYINISNNIGVTMPRKKISNLNKNIHKIHEKSASVNFQFNNINKTSKHNDDHKVHNFTRKVSFIPVGFETNENFTYNIKSTISTDKKSMDIHSIKFNRNDKYDSLFNYTSNTNTNHIERISNFDKSEYNYKNKLKELKADFVKKYLNVIDLVNELRKCNLIYL